MNKFINKIAVAMVGIAMAVGVGVAIGGNNSKQVRAVDVGDLVYTLDGTITASGNAYATATNLTQSSIDWAVVGNTEQNPWRIGGKTLSGVDRAIYSKTAINKNIAQIEVKSGATGSSLTVNSLTISVHSSAADASDDDGGNPIAKKTVTSGIVSSTVIFTRTDDTSWKDCFFRIVYNVSRSNTSGNGYVTFESAKFYEEEGSCEHTWGSWTTKTAATCTEAGEEQRECSKCHKKEYRATDALGHDWEAGTIHAPTCTEAGYTEYSCSRCDEEKHDDVIAALGHNYVDHVCTRCGADEPNEETAYLDSFDAISGYVDDDHFISYEAAQGTAQTAPAVNDGEIRIYQNGGLLTVTANDGAKIKSITIGSSMVTSVNVTVDEVDSGEENIAANDTLTVDDLNADEVIFECTGADKSHRLYLNYLSVTFDAPVITKYTISYDANANGEETGSMSSTIGTNPVVAACAFERDGYSFVVWNTQADGEGDDYSAGTAVTVDLTLYAIWQEYIEPIGGDVTMTGTDAATSVTVNGHNGIKCGTGKAGGSMTLTLNKANIEKIKVYVAGWSADTTVVSVDIDNGTISESSLALTSDANISGNVTSFTLDGDETLYVFTLTITNAPANSVITLSTSAGNKRFVVWGATNLFAETFATEFLANTSCNVNGTTEPTFNNDSSWALLESSFNGLDDQEKGILRSAQYTKTGSGSQTVVTPETGTTQLIANAMARYDYIEGKYNPNNSLSSPWKNFIGRAVTPISGSNLVSARISSDDNVTAAVTIISMTGLAAVGGFFFIRKKKIIK